MKNRLQLILSVLTLSVMAALSSGCMATAPEYYEELTDKERAALINSARVLALKGNAVPAHLQNVFMELAPYERIVYEGNKRGRASFRWEIYESSGNNRRITQKDINPYWVMVYATGNLRDPEWKLSHARENPGLPDPPAAGRSAAPQGNRSVRKVQYKR